jgi:acyl carrier protein
LGYLDEEGYLYITGRKKELIVLAGGKNINPEELEAEFLKESPVVKEVGVLEMDGMLYALIHPDFEKAKELKLLNLEEYIRWEVVDKVNRRLPPWKRVVGFKISPQELPKTRLGKLRRFLLPRLYKSLESKREEKTEEPKPLDQEGKPLIDFLSSLSGREVKLSHHLELDLGLDSLAKVELLAFLESNFGIKIKEEELSLYPTVGRTLELRAKSKAKGPVGRDQLGKNLALCTALRPIPQPTHLFGRTIYPQALFQAIQLPTGGGFRKSSPTTLYNCPQSCLATWMALFWQVLCPPPWWLIPTFWEKKDTLEIP